MTLHLISFAEHAKFRNERGIWATKEYRENQQGVVDCRLLTAFLTFVLLVP